VEKMNQEINRAKVNRPKRLRIRFNKLIPRLLLPILIIVLVFTGLIFIDDIKTNYLDSFQSEFDLNIGHDSEIVYVNEIALSNPKILDRIEVKDSQEKEVIIKSRIIDNKVEIEFEESIVKKIAFNDMILNEEMKFGVEDLESSKFEEQKFVQTYAIDPSALNFTNATVTVVATGTTLYKCADWNFTLQECFGEWELFKTDLIPGEEYTFILTPDDPGFGEVIEINYAIHLDSDRNFIADVYDLVKARDNTYALIPEGNYLRITFEEELDYTKDITIYAKSSNDGRVEVYEKDSDVKIADFGTISDDKKYQILLINLEGVQGIFDLKVVDGDVEFDFIIDPLETIVVNFTTTGSWTVPQGVTEIMVEAWGAGGAGGGNTNNGQGGAGGGGGQYAKSNISVTPGQSLSINVGAGGTGSTGAGTNGGDTTLNSTTIVAKGGTGGATSDTGGQGVGNQAGSIGDVIYFGGDGSNVAGSSGGGGGGAGSTGAGGPASGITAGIGTLELGGNGGTGLSAGSGGNPGNNYGGAGSGGRRQGGPTTGVAGDGAPGFLRITYVDPFCGGNGTINNPYLICTMDGLNAIRYNLTANYKLNNSIDMNHFPYNSGEGWLPIGNNTHPFLGTLNGSGYMLSNLYINRSSQEYVGLFGYLNSQAGISSVISKLGLEEVNIRGNGYTGGMTGYITGVWNAESMILESYVTGIITGAGSTGCMIGYTTYQSYTKDCYTICNVTGGWGTGGFSGAHWGGQIINSYAIAEIGGSGGGRGGFTGQGSSTVTDSYWNIDLFATSSTGEGKTTDELQNISTFNNWDIVEFEDYDDENWFIKNSVDYPRLGWEDITYPIGVDISIISPINTTYNNATQLVNITATGDNIDTIWYNWNGTNITYTNPINVTFNEGSNTLHAWANNSDGNVSSTNVTFEIDTIAPKIEIIYPENKTYLSNNVFVKINAIDSNLDTIWYNWNGTNITYTNEFYLNLEDGNYTLQAWANDSVGNLNYTNVSFEVIGGLYNGVPYCSEGISPCIAGSELLKCRNSVNDGNGPEPNEPNTIDDCTDGTAVFYSPSCGGFDESVENITITSYNDTYFRMGDTVRVEAWIACDRDNPENTRIGLVYTSNASNPDWRVIHYISSCPSSGYQLIVFDNFTLDNVAEDHAIRVYASYDTAPNTSQTCAVRSSGNRYDDNDDVVVTVLEHVPPNITINSPQNITYQNDTLLLNITAESRVGIDTIWFNWNGTNVTYTEPINITFNEGSNTLTAWANDTYGNVNTTNVTFSIDTFQPILGFTLTLPGQAPVYGSESGNATSTIFFNSSSNTFYNMNPCVEGTENCQNSSTPFFVYTNTGNLNLDFMIYLNQSLPDMFELKANNIFDSSSSDIINTTPLLLGLNITPSNNLNIWFFGSFINAYPKDSTNISLISNATQS
jgi:hypothetical protein